MGVWAVVSRRDTGSPASAAVSGSSRWVLIATSGASTGTRSCNSSSAAFTAASWRKHWWTSPSKRWLHMASRAIPWWWAMYEADDLVGRCPWGDRSVVKSIASWKP